MRVRRRREKLTEQGQKFLEDADRSALRASILGMGCSAALKDCNSSKEAQMILRVITIEFIPTLQNSEDLFERAYSLRARTRKNPKPRKTAPKSANDKKKTV